MLKKFVKKQDHIGIGSGDYDAALDFYKKLGFKITYETPEKDKAFLKLSDCAIEIYKTDGAPVSGGAISHFSLETDDIDAAFECVKSAGYDIVTGDKPVTVPIFENGESYFLFKGPNGEMIELCQIL